jgi:hypothetical protein
MIKLKGPFKRTKKSDFVDFAKVSNAACIVVSICILINIAVGAYQYHNSREALFIIHGGVIALLVVFSVFAYRSRYNRAIKSWEHVHVLGFGSIVDNIFNASIHDPDTKNAVFLVNSQPRDYEYGYYHYATDGQTMWTMSDGETIKAASCIGSAGKLKIEKAIERFLEDESTKKKV